MKTFGIVAAFALMVLLGLLYWASHRGMPWRATAVLLIERADSPSVSSAEDSRAFVDNELAAIRRVGASMLADGEDIKVTPLPKTHLVEVTVWARDPDTSAKRCNAIVDAYRDAYESRRGLGRVAVIDRAEPPKARDR